MKKKKEETEKTITDCKYGLKVVNIGGENIHYCLYFKMPKLQDFENLREELRTDEDFGIGDAVDCMKILRMTSQEIEDIKKELKK
jgi:hypothetical protein